MLFNNNPVQLSAPDAPTIINVASTNPVNCGSADGSITITATGGSGFYQYSIDSGATYQAANLFNNVAPGSYTTFIRNADGTCAVIGQTVVIEDKIPATILNVASTDPTECGVSDGSITIIANSSIGNSLEYSINGGTTYQASNVFSALDASGNPYEIRVRNADGSCVVTSADITLTDKVQPVITTVMTGDPNDCNSPNGFIEITATGVSLEYSIDGGVNWQPGNTFSGLGAGTYNVVTRNTDGSCETPDANNPYILTAPNSPTITNVASSDPTNCGVSDGIINVTASGGTAPLQYSIDSGATWAFNNGQFMNLAGGTYHVFVKNSDGSCLTTGPIEVLEDKVPAVITSVVSADPTDCGVVDGTITITASSPVGATLQYSINGGTTWQQSEVYSGLAGGTYQIRVRNIDGTCEVSDADVVITDKILPVINSVASADPTNCGIPDGTITVSATGVNLEYSINGGVNWQVSGNFTGLTSGVYTVTVRNVDGTCEVVYPSNPVTLAAPNSPSIANVSSTNPTECSLADGTIIITGTGGAGSYEYSIDSGATWATSGTFTGLAGGDYTTFIRNQNGSCEVIGQTVTLDDKVAPVIANIVKTDPTDCGFTDGTITITASSVSGSVEYSIDGGVTYQPSNVFSALSGGFYNVAVRNIDGTCEVISTPAILIIDKVEPVITNVATTNPANCNNPDGSIIISATGNTLEYSIDGGINWQASNTFTGLTSGNYNIITRNTDGSCEVSDANNPYQLIAPAAPSITNVASTNPTDCNSSDGTITISATGGQGSYQYSIDSGATWLPTGTFNNLAGGTYHIFISNADGTCETTGPIEVLEEKVAPVIANVIVENVSDCGVVDGRITILASSGQGSVEYSIDGGTTWQPSNIFSGLIADDYDVRVRNIDGTCEVSGPLSTITAPLVAQIVSVTPTNPSDCSINDGSIIINTNPTSGVEFSIDGGFTWSVSNTFTGLTSGNFQISVRNTDGSCQVNSSTITLTAPAAPSIVNVSETHPTDCDSLNGTIVITATGGQGSYEYSVDSGATYQASNTFNGLASGDYFVFVRNLADGSCPVTNPTVTLVSPAAATISDVVSTDPTDCGISDGTITITASSPNGSLEYSKDGGANWQPSNLFIGLSGGSYDVRVRNITGSCEVAYGSVIITDPIAVSISNVLTADPTDCDSLNGTLTVITTGGGNYEYSIDGGVNYGSDSIFTNLGAGTYNVAVRNVGGACEVFYGGNSIQLNTPNAPVVNFTTNTDPQFCGVNDGSIVINVTPGSGIVQYSIDSMSTWKTSPAFTGLRAGTYYIFVRNIDGSCVTSYPPQVLNEGPIAASDYASNYGATACLGDSMYYTLANINGVSFASYSVIPNAGWVQESFTADSIVIKFYVVGLGLVDYDIVVQNANGCEYAENISYNAQPGPSTVIQDQEACYDSLGLYPLSVNEISIDGQPVAANNTVFYYSNDGTFSDANDPNSTFTPTVNTPGEYIINIRVTDGQGCPGYEAFTYTVIGLQSVNMPDQSVCQGGSALLSASGGINYLWSVISGDAASLTSTTSNTISVTPTVTTVYEVTSTTADGCVSSTQVTVTVNSSLSLDNPIALRDATACGTCDGQITIDVANGTAPFTVQYDSAGTVVDTLLLPNAAGELILSGLCAADYTSFVITDANGCSVNDPSLGNTYTIDGPTGPTVNFVTTQNTSACSTCDGELILNIDVNTLGTAPYTVSFDSLGTVITRTGLTLTNGNQIRLTGLCDGFYNAITVTDATGCPSAPSFGPYQIDAPTGLQLGSGGVTTTEPVTCTSCDGQVLISVDGGNVGIAPYTVTFDSSGVTVTRTGLILDASLNIILDDLCAGDYENLVITDAGGCPISSPVPLDGPYTIDQPNAPVTVGGVTPTDLSSCNTCDGELVIDLNGTDFSTAPYTVTYDSLGITVVRSGLALNVNSQIVLDGLCLGAYENLEIVDNNGCTVFAPFPIDGPFDVEQPATVTLFGGVTATDVSACSSCNGEIAIGVTGGTLPYTVTFDYNGVAQTAVQIFAINANSELVLDNLCAGDYTNFVVSDAGNCSVNNPSLSGPVVVGQPDAPFVQSLIVDNSSCFTADGSIILNMVGTASDFTYTWLPNLGQPNADDNARTELPAGTYAIGISSPTSGCDTTITVVINNTDGPAVTMTTSKANCGQANGLAILSPNTLTYTWNDAVTGNIRTDLTAGTYTVTATDGNCESIVQVMIEDSSLISATGAVVSLPTACGETDGSAVVNAFGGNAPYTYTWSDATVATNQGLFMVRNDLLAGAYSVTVEDVTGCIGVTSFVLPDSNAVGASLAINSVSNVSCPGANDGNINFTTNLGTGFVGTPVTVITDGISIFTNGSLPAGTYCVELRDGNNCVLADSCITITAPNTITATIDVTNETCTGNDGAIDLSIAGGTGPFTFNWSDGSSSEDILTATAGDYSVTITDVNGCSVTINGGSAINVGNDCSCDDLFISGVTSINSQCGLSRGYAEVNITGGSGNYTYSWSSGLASTSNSASNLASGYYEVSVTDVDGCEVIQSFVIGDSDGPDVVVSNVNDATCAISQGSILLGINTGTAPFTIRWNGAGSDTVTLASLGTYTMANLDAGMYSIEVQDAGGCIGSLTQVVGLSNAGLRNGCKCK